VNYSSKVDYAHWLLSERKSCSITNFVHSLPAFWVKVKSLHYMPMHAEGEGGGGVAPTHS
jgi:hypothetical protein